MEFKEQNKWAKGGKKREERQTKKQSLHYGKQTDGGQSGGGGQGMGEIEDEDYRSLSLFQEFHFISCCEKAKLLIFWNCKEQYFKWFHFDPSQMTYSFKFHKCSLKTSMEPDQI